MKQAEIKKQLATIFGCVESELTGQNIHDCLRVAARIGNVKVMWGALHSSINDKSVFE